MRRASGFGAAVMVCASIVAVPGGTIVVEAIVDPSERLCFDVAGSPADAALVNLTPVLAQGAGNGQLVSSDVSKPPLASNVNFLPGTTDPNVAVATVGGNGQVCYVNSTHTSVHLVADHLGTIDADAYTPASTSGAPARKIDTRDDPADPELTSCEGTDLSKVDGRLAQPVVCSFPWGLAETTTVIGSGPTVIVTLLKTDERAVLASWWEVEEGPAVSGYTVEAIASQGLPIEVAQLLFDTLDACSGCAYRR